MIHQTSLTTFLTFFAPDPVLHLSIDNNGELSCGDTPQLRLLKVTRQALTFVETNPRKMSERERLSM